VHDVTKIGHFSFRRKNPEMHIALGNPYGAHMAPKCIRALRSRCRAHFDIWIDGLQIMHRGAFRLIPPCARKFNEEFSEEKYQRFLSLLEERTGSTYAVPSQRNTCFFPSRVDRSLALRQ